MSESPFNCRSGVDPDPGRVAPWDALGAREIDVSDSQGPEWGQWRGADPQGPWGT